ncbi:MAG: zf-HC2 domain-containing protein [Piscinibacter sp.]|uniref:anti-sigma factor family protein n=1 Tax=Piscinibacter sp. TaxID=1903157 RepID=UPI003D0C757D
MLNCKEVTEVCSAEMERPLRLGEQVSLRTHLMMCTGCSEYRRQLKTLRQVMQAYAEGKAIADDAAPGQGNG